jgi:hypothetical protein
MRWASALVLFASTLAVDGDRVRWLLPGVHDNEIDGLMFSGNAVAGAGSLLPVDDGVTRAPSPELSSPTPAPDAFVEQMRQRFAARRPKGIVQAAASMYHSSSLPAAPPANSMQGADELFRRQQVDVRRGLDALARFGSSASPDATSRPHAQPSAGTDYALSLPSDSSERGRAVPASGYASVLASGHAPEVPTAATAPRKAPALTLSPSELREKLWSSPSLRDVAAPRFARRSAELVSAATRDGVRRRCTPEQGKDLGVCKACVYTLERIKQGMSTNLQTICVEIHKKTFRGQACWYQDENACYHTLDALDRWGIQVKHWMRDGCYKVEVYGQVEKITPCPSHVICAQLQDPEKVNFCEDPYPELSRDVGKKTTWAGQRAKWSGQTQLPTSKNIASAALR